MSAAEAFHRSRHGERPVGPKEHEQLVAAMLAKVEDEALRDHYSQRLEHADELAQRKRIRLIDLAAEVLPELSRRRGPRASSIRRGMRSCIYRPTRATFSPITTSPAPSTHSSWFSKRTCCSNLG